MPYIVLQRYSTLFYLIIMERDNKKFFVSLEQPYLTKKYLFLWFWHLSSCLKLFIVKRNTIEYTVKQQGINIIYFEPKYIYLLLPQPTLYDPCFYLCIKVYDLGLKINIIVYCVERQKVHKGDFSWRYQSDDITTVPYI